MRLNTLHAKKVALHMLFLIIMQELKLVHMILCLYKKTLTFLMRKYFIKNSASKTPKP